MMKTILGSGYMKDYNDIENLSKNEIDPRLRFDAFTAGMKDGGLRSVTSINLLVCYIIANINGKVTAQNIIDAVNEGMIANYFEISDAIARLKKANTIVEDENGVLSLNVDAGASIDLIEHDLPLTIREESIKLCQKIIAKETYQRENKVEIVKLENGYNVVLHISDMTVDYMTLTLFAPTIEQAEMMKDKFITNPIKVYENLIEGIFNN